MSSESPTTISFPNRSAKRRFRANDCFNLRVQLVTATLLVVYRQGFQSPRSSAVVD